MKDSKCWDTAWPHAQLESVHQCPVCNSIERSLLYSDLVDNVFFVAIGRWDIYQCGSCQSAYLDPRPSQTSIHKAYGVYYTHSSSSVNHAADNLGLLKRIRKMLSNGFFNYHFGTQRKPQIKLGRWLLRLWPGFYSRSQARFRYVKRPSGKRNKLLDVGCGNGDYMALAAELGWQVTGVEPDGKASAVARGRGLNVLSGGIEELSSIAEGFDVITISHVIEHVYDASSLLKKAYELLKPGGTLFVETPNIEGFGANNYGCYWRGLEVPRHLVIFSKKGLTGLMYSQGFHSLSFKSRLGVTNDLALKSYRIQIGKSPYDKKPKRLPFPHLLHLLASRAYGDEFLTVVANKPQ